LGEVFGTAYAVGGLVTAGVMMRWAVPKTLTWLTTGWPTGLAQALLRVTSGALLAAVLLGVGIALVCVWPATALFATQRANRMDALRQALEDETDEALFTEARTRAARRGDTNSSEGR
jgi:hypothetical protein